MTFKLRLRPCPFCGGHPQMFCVDKDSYFVTCGSCDIWQEADETPLIAQRKWNGRIRFSRKTTTVEIDQISDGNGGYNERIYNFCK
jgi:transcription elongation factor Elf1